MTKPYLCNFYLNFVKCAQFAFVSTSDLKDYAKMQLFTE